jgi:hypothetical protein
LFVIIGVAVAAKQILGPLLDWPVILFLLGLAAVHHAIWFWGWRKRRREREGRPEFDQPDED